MYTTNKNVSLSYLHCLLTRLHPHFSCFLFFFSVPCLCSCCFFSSFSNAAPTHFFRVSFFFFLLQLLLFFSFLQCWKNSNPWWSTRNTFYFFPVLVVCSTDVIGTFFSFLQHCKNSNPWWSTKSTFYFFLFLLFAVQMSLESVCYSGLP